MPQIAVANQSPPSPEIATLSLASQFALPSLAIDGPAAPSAKDASAPSQSTSPDVAPLDEIPQLPLAKQTANLAGISSSPEQLADPKLGRQVSVRGPVPPVNVASSPRSQPPVTSPVSPNLGDTLVASPTSTITPDAPELPPAVATPGEHTETPAKPPTKPALPILPILDSPTRDAVSASQPAIASAIASVLAELNNISSTDSQPSAASTQGGSATSSSAAGAIANASAPVAAVVTTRTGPINAALPTAAVARNTSAAQPAQPGTTPVIGIDSTQHQSSTANGQAAPIQPISSPLSSGANNVAASPVQIAVSANSGLDHKPETPAPPNSADPRPTVRPPVELPPSLPGGPVQTAQLLERAGQSEMRIALSTTAFGNVEVHTVVHANEVGVSIGSEKGDLRSLLTNDLPAISSTLQQQNVRLHHVDFQNSSTLSNSPGGNSQQPRSFTRPTVHLADLDNAIRPGDGFDPIEGAVRGLNTGLNILA